MLLVADMISHTFWIKLRGDMLFCFPLEGGKKTPIKKQVCALFLITTVGIVQFMELYLAVFLYLRH